MELNDTRCNAREKLLGEIFEDLEWGGNSRMGESHEGRGPFKAVWVEGLTIN